MNGIMAENMDFKNWSMTDLLTNIQMRIISFIGEDNLLQSSVCLDGMDNNGWISGIIDLNADIDLSLMELHKQIRSGIPCKFLNGRYSQIAQQYISYPTGRASRINMIRDRSNRYKVTGEASFYGCAFNKNNNWSCKFRLHPSTIPAITDDLIYAKLNDDTIHGSVVFLNKKVFEYGISHGYTHHWRVRFNKQYAKSNYFGDISNLICEMHDAE
jgi:hypothetical protein